MTLTLSVLRCPDAVPPETRQLRGGEFSIGRGPENDWTLPDPDRHLSKRHCMLAFRSGQWQLADTSTNGTFLNRDTDPLGPGNPRDLRDGDRLRVGAYEIEIRIEEDAAQQQTAFPAASYGGFQAAGGNQGGGGNLGGFSDAAPGGFAGHSPAGGFAGHPTVHDDPFGDDPFKPPAPPRGNPFHDDPMQQSSFGLGNAPVALPHDFDVLGGELGMPGGAPTQSDHTAAFSDAFAPPRPLPSGIPDDWDLDLTPRPAADPFAPAAAPPPFAPEPFAPEPVAPPPSAPPPSAPPPSAAPPAAVPPVAPPPAAAPPVAPAAFQPAPPAPMPAAPPPAMPDPFAPPAPAVPPPLPAPAPFAAAPAAIPDDFATSPFDEPELARPTAPPPPRAPSPSFAAAAPPAPVAPAATDGALMTAFLHGADMDGTEVGDQANKMTALGAAFRALVGGLRQVLIARAAIKGEFRIEQTMIRARGNNPLKFSTGDDDALAALLGAGRRSDMTPQAAVADALTDIRLHELATMAAMQSAVRALLARFDPAAIRSSAAAGGGITLPGQAKSRAWDEFERQHATTTQALTDDFDSVFGKVFARAYEQALDDVTAKEKRS